jgi:hypothetical protein
MMRSGVADQPERSNPSPRLFPTFAVGVRAIFRQVAWLMTACNLPTQIRTLWRLLAREMTIPRSHSKRPRKAKAPRPF